MSKYGAGSVHMDPLEIVYAYYDPDAALTRTLVRHSEQVRGMALAIADTVPHLNPDKRFIAQAAMLHDIGIRDTHAPKLQCHGKHPYIRHGIIGRQMLERDGFPDHALVCERHVGIGITREEIVAQGLPLPVRDMVPQTIEEIIICYADEFFSKTHGADAHALETVIAGVQRYGETQLERFMGWHEMFHPAKRRSA
jgi:uncharacterized protein